MFFPVSMRVLLFRQLEWMPKRLRKRSGTSRPVDACPKLALEVAGGLESLTLYRKHDKT